MRKFTNFTVGCLILAVIAAVWMLLAIVELRVQVDEMQEVIESMQEDKEISATVTALAPPPVQKEEVVEEVPEVSRELWGNCRITAYCACEKCCGEWANNRPVDPATGEQIVTGARGTQLTSGYSVACNLPFGTILEIDGFDGMQFEVEDRTSQWVQEKYNGMTVDIYIDDHQECYEFMSGHSDWSDVYIVKGD